VHKEKIIEVDKVWGEEIWLVNLPEYCGKLLLLDTGAESSYHMHPVKKETFMAIEGYATLIVEGKEYMLAPFTRAKTIMPGERHKFIGITNAVILEISTHHSDDDVVRFSESTEGRRELDTNSEPE